MSIRKSADVLQARIAELQVELQALRQKERELLDLQNEHRLYLEKSDDVMFSITPAGKILGVSQSVEKMLGYSPAELVSRNIGEVGIIGPASLEKALVLMAHVCSGGKMEREQFDFIARDGSRRVGEVTGVSLVANGDGLALVAVGHDVTQNVHAREELMEANERMDTLLQAIPDIVYFKDAAGRYLLVNEAFEQFSGLTREEIEGRMDHEVLPKECFRLARRSHDMAMASARAVHLEETFTAPDGRLAVFDTVKAPIFDDQGKIMGLVGVSRNVTGRKKGEEALRESEERYRSFVESAFFGCVIFEIASGRFILLNEAACRMFGYEMEQARTMTIWDIIRPEEHRDLMERFITRLDTRLPYSSPEIYTGVRRDGAFIRIRVNAAPIPYLGNTVMQCVFVDATELEQLEKQFQQAQRMEAVGTLAGGIAHDFNNLLMGVLGNISLMLTSREEEDDDCVRLRSMERYVLRASELTKRLLGFARGGMYEVKATDLGEFSQRSLEMFSRTRKEIQVHYAGDEGLWAVEVDHGQMEQVLLNLFVNAWQAMPDGGDLFVECRNVMLNEGEVELGTLKSGKFVSVLVRDTGYGMDKATRERIFDPFFTTKERGIGTGLGLASVYGIVKNHGGFITVESDPGFGSGFRIFLPASAKTPEREGRADTEVKAGAETVLLVDDEDVIIEVGTDMLRHMGYKVLTAHSGEDAILVYENNRHAVDLVILDIIMPGMGGAKTYELLRKIDPKVRVLLSSGYSIDGQAKDILAKGCNGFIQKPFSVHDLSLKIREVIERG